MLHVVNKLNIWLKKSQIEILVSKNVNCLKIGNLFKKIYILAQK